MSEASSPSGENHRRQQRIADHHRGMANTPKRHTCHVHFQAWRTAHVIKGWLNSGSLMCIYSSGCLDRYGEDIPNPNTTCLGLADFPTFIYSMWNHPVVTREECFTAVICPTRSIWAVGVGMRGGSDRRAKRSRSEEGRRMEGRIPIPFIGILMNRTVKLMNRSFS